MGSLNFRPVNTVNPQTERSAVKLPERMVMKVEGPKQFSVMDLEILFGLVLVCCWVWAFNFPLERSAGISLFLYFKENNINSCESLRSFVMALQSAQHMSPE